MVEKTDMSEYIHLIHHIMTLNLNIKDRYYSGVKISHRKTGLRRRENYEKLQTDVCSVEFLY